MNILMCSVGRRSELIKNFKKSLGDRGRVIAVDGNNSAPALYFADKQYIVPKITEESYIPSLLSICKRENIRAVTTLIDPEISLLAQNRSAFEALGVEVLVPDVKTAKLCFDKYAMYHYLVENGVNTVPTYGNIEEYKKGQFPVFVKPRTGSGSVGARMICDKKILQAACAEDPSLIIQEYMDGVDLTVDVYVDTISHKAVSIFAKKKIETKIGGANKTISFKDDKLFCFIETIVDKFWFNGPVDMDLFYKDGKYYLSEINPRFGGAYLHAYGAGIDFIELIVNNLNGKENYPLFGNYEDDLVMMMYDSVVFKKKSELCSEEI